MSALPDPGCSVAVLIGTSVYDDTGLGVLPAVTNNVQDLASTLTDVDLWGLPPDRTVVLLDRADPSDVMIELEEGSRRATDTFIVYFAGHGLVRRDGQLHLATRATRCDMVHLTAIPYSDVRQVVHDCRARRRIVILDCCFSGRALGGMSDTASAVIGQVDVEGTYVLTSSPSTELSKAPEGARYTAFTGGLLTTLREGVAGRTEVLSLDDVYEDVMQAMARFGWPRPQQLGSNLIGRLGIVRNRAISLLFPHRRPSCGGDVPPAPEPSTAPEPAAAPEPEDVTRRAATAAGVSTAVQVAAARFGEPGADGLATLEAATEGDPARDAGRTLVLDTMRVMREQYGDGATLSAIVLDRLVAGLHTLLQDGASPADLDARLVGATAVFTRRLLDSALPTAAGDGSAEASGGPDPTAVRRAVVTAVGEAGAAVADACERVGADRVEVLAGTAPTDAEDGSFTIATTVLSPNALAGPVAMVEPLIAVSLDGGIDEKAVRAELGGRRRDLLIIAPRVSPWSVRALLHRCGCVVVVRPTDPQLDLAALRRRLLDRNGTTCGTAQRALVLAGSTTIDRPSLGLDVGRSRQIVRVDPDADEELAVVARALAVARAATHGPVVPDGPALLSSVAGTGADDASDELTAAVRDVVHRAAGEPQGRLRTSSPDTGPGDNSSSRADCVKTVSGAVSHAAASARRFLC